MISRIAFRGKYALPAYYRNEGDIETSSNFRYPPEGINSQVSFVSPYLENEYLPGHIKAHDEVVALLKSDNKDTVVLGHKIEDLDKMPIEILPRHAPEVAKLEKVSVSSMEELKQLDKPIEDQICVWFGKNMPTIEDDKKPERDLVNFPRPVRPVEAPATRLGFFPDTWFRFLYDKTGVTGPYVLAVGFTTFLFSKEIYVIGHGTISGITIIFWLTVFLKTLGKKVGDYLEKTVLADERRWLKWQDGTIKLLEDYIAATKHNEEAVKNQKILFDAKRENIHLQREAEYRRRMMEVYGEAKRKLDYQVAMQDTVRQFSQNHMVSWIIDSVNKGIGPEQEKQAFSQAISQLKTISAKRANVI
ncbi:ATP synthase subunit b-like protein [Leptotrombidium deliense]|uniref:ATP synthase subunit b n=1 Tax=Leptotrombidium deliense TaxID=299467 RepID=A0A443SHF5_9ACAR|nr:ATP synthase subunit b-like protein [Leptotrombidium deliense]